MRATAERIVANTESQIAAVGSGPGPASPPTSIHSPDYHVSTPIYTDKPHASGRKRFKASVSNLKLYTLSSQRSRGGYTHDHVFYVFPNSASPEPVPSGYVVVGGADYNSFLSVFYRQNLVTRYNKDQWGNEYSYESTLEPNYEQVLLADPDDLEDAP